MNILMAEHTHYRSIFQVGCHHIARGLRKKGHRITYVSRFLSPTLPINFREKKIRFVNYLKGGEIESNGIYTYVPFTFLPLIKFPLLDNDWIAKKAVLCTIPKLAQFCQKRGPFDAFLVGDPFFVPIMPFVDCDQTILRLTDNLTAFDHVPKAAHVLLEQGLNACDKVIVTSQPLLKMLKMDAIQKPVYYVPNGVDYAHFSKTDLPEPSDLKNIPHPRAIYVGALDDWFDADLLERSASHLKDVSFVIIGPPKIDLNRIGAFPNVHILGPRSYDLVPHYLAHSDVGIIPFKKNQLTDCVSPVKLYEYMASGLPVVSVKWKELQAIRSPARLAKDDSHFIHLMTEAIENSGDQMKIKTFAKENSWSKRVDDIERIINSSEY
ncbi:glycosyltransferase [Thermodesulfobacteriota bacterium]